MNDLTSEVTLLTEASADTSGAGGEPQEPQGPLDEFKMREVQVRENIYQSVVLMKSIEGGSVQISEGVFGLVRSLCCAHAGEVSVGHDGAGDDQ